MLILKIKSISGDQEEELKSSEVGQISAAEKEEELKSSEVGQISAAEEEVELRSSEVSQISAAEEEEFIRKNEGPKELRSNKGIIGIASIWGIWYIYEKKKGGGFINLIEKINKG